MTHIKLMTTNVDDDDYVPRNSFYVTVLLRQVCAAAWGLYIERTECEAFVTRN